MKCEGDVRCFDTAGICDTVGQSNDALLIAYQRKKQRGVTALSVQACKQRSYMHAVNEIECCAIAQ